MKVLSLLPFLFAGALFGCFLPLPLKHPLCLGPKMAAEW